MLCHHIQMGNLLIQRQILVVLVRLLVQFDDQSFLSAHECRLDLFVLLNLFFVLCCFVALISRCEYTSVVSIAKRRQLVQVRSKVQSLQQINLVEDYWVHALSFESFIRLELQCDWWCHDENARFKRFSVLHGFLDLDLRLGEISGVQINHF